MTENSKKTYTGLVIAADKLILATLCREGVDLELAPELCLEIVLADRGQSALLAFHQETQEFCLANGLVDLTLRQVTVQGPYKGHGFGPKIEAALQFIPSIRLTFVDPRTVTAWQKQADRVLPGPDKARLKSPLANMQAQAIAVAAWSSLTAVPIGGTVSSGGNSTSCM